MPGTGRPGSVAALGDEGASGHSILGAGAQSPEYSLGMSDRTRQQGHHAFWLTVAALTWSSALVAAAFLLPVYGSSETSSAGTHTSGSLTLVAVTDSAS